ncbi:hypothetical protein [Paenibacillus xylanexedens]|uniref:hypothetical protein n=1 Tax=Paenibacillus xylanexedens TaxID=528191 RepID=UPI00119DD9EA|nr:hypothetical protein [Paenibacillus xylanexedens]
MRKVLRRLMPVELSLAFIASFWGVLLVLPFNTFATSSAYAPMSNVMPESAWGVLMLFLSGLLLYGMLSGRFLVRRYALLVATFVWLFIGSMLFFGNPASTGWGAYLNYAILSSWAYMRVGEQRHGR